jgi:hypothetical protein
LKLPNADRVHIPEDKLRRYVLSADHQIGRFKARFFARLGYTADNWEQLRDHLRALAEGDAEVGPATEFGQKYVVSGTLEGPGGTGDVVTIWIVLTGDDAPRFVTVYPR